MNWRIVSLIVSGIAGLIGLSLTSCSTVDRAFISPPRIEGASFVGNSACNECHSEIVRGFPASVHGRFYKDDPAWAGMTGCESCHGAGSKHVAAGGGRSNFIVNPGKDPANCLQCHFDIQADFHLPNHHPVLEGDMNCVQCHDPHGRDIFKPSGNQGLALSRLNESCAQCHQEQARPVVYEHEAMREGCVTCHEPHGSINSKLLVQRDNNLCLKCHSQVQVAPRVVVIGKIDHTLFLQGRTCWSAGCHSAIHGSSVNPKMLY